MRANYHTHTVRCHHATGSDEQYVLEAINAGYDVLGFSDHVPYEYSNGYVSPIRMSISELDDYFTSLTKLRDSYKKDITIYVGFEAEYIPEHMESLLRTVQQYPVDYLILGQHHTEPEYCGRYTGAPTYNDTDLIKYSDSIIEGMNTGLFACLAHPDLICYLGNHKLWQEQMLRICSASKQLGVPVEINFQGYQKGRHYPCRDFFELAAKAGCDIIFGCDAHIPEQLSDNAAIASCCKAVKPDGVELISELDMGLLKHFH